MLKAIFFESSGGGGGADELPYQAVTGTFTTVGTEQMIEAISGTFNLTLTSPSTSAFPLWIKNSGAGVVTILATIDGGSSFALGPKASVLLMFNGTSWLVF